MAPLPDYHWCPGQFWDQGWGNNWDWDRCHDDGFFDGEPRDQGHWHGYGPWQGGPDWDNHGGPVARVGTTTVPVVPVVPVAQVAPDGMATTAGEPVVTINE